MKCAFVAVVSVATAEHLGNGNSINRAAAVAADIVGFSVGKQAATGYWRVTAPVVSVRCSDTVARLASVEGSQASSALMALVSLRTVFKQVLSTTSKHLNISFLGSLI